MRGLPNTSASMLAIWYLNAFQLTSSWIIFSQCIAKAKNRDSSYQDPMPVIYRELGEKAGKHSMQGNTASNPLAARFSVYHVLPVSKRDFVA